MFFLAPTPTPAPIYGKLIQVFFIFCQTISHLQKNITLFSLSRCISLSKRAPSVVMHVPHLCNKLSLHYNIRILH